ncbi:MAG: response regulator [Deltaproteobacteria bacterium]|nr:MAG: response regulator [Deltaproteobacteria bacterium]
MKPKKVLVVDDSKLLHKIFDLMLRNCTVVHAGDGVDGLEKLAKAENADVDLILLDMNMPRMNGLQFLAQIKADKAKAAIPVIVITTEGKEADAERGIKAGASAYLRKPFKNEELLAVIEGLSA